MELKNKGDIYMDRKSVHKNVEKKSKKSKVRKGLFFAILAIAVVVVVVNAKFKKDWA